MSQTIFILLGAALLAGGAASTYLMVRCAHISSTYTAILHGEVAQSRDIRVLQVTFKKQVQAWKDILLRGKDDAALAKYQTEFKSLEDDTQASAERLAGEVKDPEARAGLQNFVAQHQQLDREYEVALAGFATSRDAAAADLAVKGKDRAPTDSLDGVVARLTQLADQVPQAQTARLRREQGFLIATLALLWAALATWSVSFARSIGFRLSACVSFVRSIADGDLTAAAPQDQHADELGELVKAMTEMQDKLHRMVISIQAASGTLSVNAEEVSASSNQITQAVAQQRSQADQVASALEEIITTVQEVSQHCQSASNHATHTGELASNSCEAVHGVANRVRDLAAEAQQNALMVQDLGARSEKITQIVTLIEEIAGQTNLLALNAAIESARAGEHGRGFAVVAGEVRRLAERTTLATKEIAEAVRSIQDGMGQAVTRIENSSHTVKGSVSSAESASDALTVLGNSTAEVEQRIAQIAQAAEEQSQASGLVGQSMNEIAAGIAASSESVEELARTAEELVRLAGQLNEQASQFTTQTADAPKRQPSRNIRRAA